jgi:hypothetical protein
MMPLTDEQIDAIAEKAAEKALAKVYEEVGRRVVKRVLWIIGSVALALMALLSAKTGHLPPIEPP